MSRRKKKSAKGRVHVTVVQDRSGSMWNLVDSTIAGFNEYVESTQNKSESEVLLTLLQFDNELGNVFVSRPIADVPKLDEETFVPRGSTRLNDAVMMGIQETKPRVRKGDGVVLVIMTDGGENSSVEFGGAAGTEKVKSELNRLKEQEGWDVLYLGAGEAAWQGAVMFNIAASSTLNYGNDDESNRSAYASVSSLTLRKAASPMEAQSFTLAEKKATEATAGAPDVQINIGAQPRRRGSGKKLK